MSSTYSEYDPSECEVPPPNRSCLRALINGPVPNRPSIMSQGGSVSDKSSDRHGSNGYGPLINHQSAFPFEDSFFSSGTMDGGVGGSGVGIGIGGTGESTSSGGGRKKIRNKVSGVICRKANNDRRRGGSGAGDRHVGNSNASHAGLLDGGSSFVSKRSGAAGPMDVLDRRESLTWKTTKTTTNSSLASSGNRSRMSRNNYGGGRDHHHHHGTNGAFPSTDDFDFVEVDDIRRRSLGKTFGGCVGYKKARSANGKHRMEYGHRRKPDDIMQMSPMAPDSPQFFKFHSALPSHRVQNTDFPQIIFANETTSDDNNYFTNGDFGRGDEFNRENNEFQQNNNNRGFEDILTSNSPDRRDPFLIHHQEDRSRSPSPVRRSNRKSFDFSNSSPRSRGSRQRSRAGSRNPSPRSSRSLKEEEQFLDNLANALTAYNSFQKQKDEHRSCDRSVFNRMLEDIPVTQVPDVIDAQIDSFDEYDYDDVSDIGMASTSGQQNDYSQDEIINPTKPDHHHERNFREKKDYFDPSIKRNQKERNTDGVAKKLNDADERSLKWRLREADKQQSNMFVRTNSLQRNPSREMMETGRSLMDQDVSGDTSIVGYQDEDEDPTYAFGGSGVRKPPLALSEGFEDFGIDDRIYPREHRPGDTFDDDDDDDDHDDYVNDNDNNRRNNQRIRNAEYDLPDPRPYPTPRKNRNKGRGDKRHSNLMNKYISNYEEKQRLGLSIEEEESSVEEHFRDAEPIAERPAMPPTLSGPRSSKYREINGGAYFSSESNSMMSMQTSKWSNSGVNEGGKPIGMPAINDETDAKGNRRHSPQSIAEYEQW